MLIDTIKNESLSTPEVEAFFDEQTSSLSYVVVDPSTGNCAVIDPVVNLDFASGTVMFTGAETILQYIKQRHLTLQWILETHVHADHLSAAPYLQQELGGRIAISREIVEVQDHFGSVFGVDEEFKRDGSQFDVLLSDGDPLELGAIRGVALHTPGHTPACMSFVFEDLVFVGDTLFMPDAGTARADFPGGDARILYRSIQKLLSLPEHYRVFVCHDYQPGERSLGFESTVRSQRAENIHVGGYRREDDFVALRESRDATLSMPDLILPALQVNMRAGRVPPPDSNDRFFLKIPLNVFGGASLNGLSADKA